MATVLTEAPRPVLSLKAEETPEELFNRRVAALQFDKRYRTVRHGKVSHVILIKLKKGRVQLKDTAEENPQPFWLAVTKFIEFYRFDDV